jgi:hypothetical protein
LPTRLLSLLVLALAGCSTAPYIPAGSPAEAGYTETLIAPATYHITYRTRRFGSVRAAGRQVLRRAADLCQGPFVAMPPDPENVTVSSGGSYPGSIRHVGFFDEAVVRCGP